MTRTLHLSLLLVAGTVLMSSPWTNGHAQARSSDGPDLVPHRAVATAAVLSAPGRRAFAERRTSAAFLEAKHLGEPALDDFLRRMPKGADLHMHLAGAVYAETYLKDAAEDLLCVDPVALRFVKHVGTTRSVPPQAVCAEGMVAAASLFAPSPAAQPLYDALIDSFSMRTFVPASGMSGHDHFFSTFDRFHGLGKRHTGEWLDELAVRAASQNEQYLEVMETPSFAHAAEIAKEIGWPAATPPHTTAETSSLDAVAGSSNAELAALRDKLLAGSLRDEVAIDRGELADALASRKRLEHCGQPDAVPACAVEIRFLYQVLRAFPPQQVFAQTLLAFEVASQDANVVGINFVQPEDTYLAMSEYHRQMAMLDYLHTVYPKVHISLHAGELAPGLVPPAGLRFHIREAVELGHAERIGHGVDVMYEDDAHALLAELAAKHVMVEINLTSNDVILGVSANHHSLPAYRAAHVPLALSTDDEGVSRIDLTHEYLRAVNDFGLSYFDLKTMARTSLEHAFLPGASLWQRPDDFTAFVSACHDSSPGTGKLKPACAQYLHGSQRATQQWELERRYISFEAARY